MTARPGYVWDGSAWVLLFAAYDDAGGAVHALRPEAFGAVGDGVTDDQSALAACIATAEPGQVVVFAAGKDYRHSSILPVAADGVTLTGGGTLTATTPDDAALFITGSGVTVENLLIRLAHTGSQLSSPILYDDTEVIVDSITPFPSGTGWRLVVDPGTSTRELMTVTGRNDGTRTFTVTRGEGNTKAVDHGFGYEAEVWPAERQEISEAHLIYQHQASNNRFLNLTLMNGDAAGLLSEYCDNYLVENCKVIGGLADSFHNTHASSGGRFQNCLAYYGGDDGFAVVSYDTVPDPVRDMLFVDCRAVGSGARAFSVVGGEFISFDNCYSEYSSAAAFYVACEASFESHGVAGVAVNDAVVIGSNVDDTIDHGSVFVYNGRGGSFSVLDVVFRNLTARYTNPFASAEIGVVGYNTPTADVLRFEGCRVYDGPVSLWNSNFTPTNWLKDVTQIFGYGDTTVPVPGMIPVAAGRVMNSNDLIIPIPEDSHATFKILIETKGSSAADIPAIQFNGDVATHYSVRYIEVPATGVTLASAELAGQTQALLGSVSHDGERVIEVTLMRETLNCTASVVQTRNPRDSGVASGAMEIAGRIQWYPGNYDPLTEVRVFNVGGALFNTIKVWVFAFPTPDTIGA